MRFKPFFLIVATALVLAASSVIATAQMTQISGKITLKQADGAEAPVVGAQIDIYRTDQKWETHIKSDKKGAYQHAGIPFVGTYTVIVSAPGARPSFLTGIRFSARPVNDFTLDPGDGSRPTLDQLKAMGTAAAGGGNKGGGAAAPPSESKESKAAREELERKNREIEEDNKKITSSNETINRTFKAGNDALFANPPRLDEAITNYREGLAARPEEVALLTNLAEALRQRADGRYNSALKEAASEARTQGIDAAKKDWVEGTELATKAVTLVKAVTPGAENVNAVGYEQNKKAAISIRALLMRRVAAKVDQSKAADALAANQEYVEMETDAAKKTKIRSETLQALFDAGAIDLVTAEAQKTLTENPDDVDANRIMGLALFASGDKAKFQQAANYLQRYVDKAPDTDPLKLSAKESLDYLKTAENIKPEKAQPTRTGGRRRP